MQILQKQYALVRGSRMALFGYFERISADRLLRRVPEFNQRSICSLQTHIANVYIVWLARFALQRPLVHFDEQKSVSVEAMQHIFAQVDEIMADFLTAFSNPDLLIREKMIGENSTEEHSVLEVFTHVITHEFHHKGQLLTMSRLLGYEPVDTDIIRA